APASDHRSSDERCCRPNAETCESRDYGLRAVLRLASSQDKAPSCEDDLGLTALRPLSYMETKGGLPVPGIRLATGCRLNVSDFHDNGEEATILLQEKGDKRRTIGLHSLAATAIAEYLEQAAIKTGPLFRPRLNPRSTKLGKTRMNEVTMYRLIESYLERLPG